MLVTWGDPTYMNWLAGPMALVPAGVVTVTSTVAGSPISDAGAVATYIRVSDSTVNDAALAEPNFTAVAPLRFVPMIRTESPLTPLDGSILVIVGGSLAAADAGVIPVNATPAAATTATSSAHLRLCAPTARCGALETS
jgi:hypothetical protein